LRRSGPAIPNTAELQPGCRAKKSCFAHYTSSDFSRISTNSRALGVRTTDARRLLEQFAIDSNAERIPADVNALESHPKLSEEVTDHYLAELAARHGSKLATFDAGIKHPSVELIN
jgi:predicted nucleic acid-binding protein